MPDDCFLNLDKLSRRLDIDGESRTIVDNVSYCFRRRTVYNILGPSGAGKSSLLRLINRLDEPTGGRVVFRGQPADQCSPCELRQHIGYLFQTPHLYDGTVAENIRYSRPHLSQGELQALATQVQIVPELLEKPIDNLSVGEKQRVALARLMATDPAVALLDEPTSALDPSRTEAIERTIKSITDKRDLTVLIVSHDPQQALRMGGEALLLVDGKLVEHGPVSQVVNEPTSEPGRKFRDRELI